MTRIYAGYVILDVSDASMVELVDSANPILQRCINKLVEDLDDPDGTISAFQSFVE